MPEIEAPDRRELRRFGITTGGTLGFLFGLLLPWLLSHPFPIWPWIAVGLLGGLALATPIALRPLYGIWMRFGHLIATINTRLILGLIFYLIVTPIGLAMRLLGADPMRRQPAGDVTSYRVPSQAKSPHHMEKPF